MRSTGTIIDIHKPQNIYNHSMKKLTLLLFCLMPALIFGQPSSETVPPHYLFPAFGKAVVKWKAGGYQPANMNYNTITEEMIFNQNEQLLAVDKLETIDSVYLNGRVFIPVNNKFFEVAYNGSITLLIQHRKTLIDGGKPAAYGGTTQTSSVTPISSISSGGNIYKLKLPDSYSTKDATLFWIKVNKKQRNFINEKQLIKILPEKKDAITAYTAKFQPNFRNAEDVLALIRYLNK